MAPATPQSGKEPAMKMDRELYEEVILDHNRNPFHYMQIPANTTHRACGFNPTCGDEFSVSLRIEDGVIQAAGFEGVGCSVSVASTSMMTEALEGLRVDEAEKLMRQMTAFLHGHPVAPEAEARPLGKLELVGGFLDYPDRIKCANLAWFILHAALQHNTQTISTE
ncbi:MAG: SUF system NifU family Fe-S cluster assembly protein [Magnetococcales bacterium]|nr:SUF system NifU family Fe-S cluster assembly protein [Magnetococcales bacterium]